MALSLSTSTSVKGASKVFTVAELRRVGNSFQPTGVSFAWSSENFTAPRGPWAYGIKLRTVRRDLPGSEIPAEQVLGWNYTPFQISGVWDDRHAGSGYAERTRRDFEAMVKRGNFARVSLEQISVEGLITEVQITYRHNSQIAYQFTFSPHQRFEGETVRGDINPSRKVVQDPRTSVQLARKGLEDLQAAQASARAANLSRVQQLLTDDLFGDINAEIETIATSITSAEKTVEKEILVAQDAANALNRGAQTMASVKTSVANILSRTRTVASTTALAVGTIIETLQFESWLRGLSANSRLMVVKTEQSRRDFALRARPKPTKLHRVRQGENLYTISTLYFGTPFHWREILAHNRGKITGIILSGGELLEIPELR